MLGAEIELPHVIWFSYHQPLSLRVIGSSTFDCNTTYHLLLLTLHAPLHRLGGNGNLQRAVSARDPDIPKVEADGHFGSNRAWAGETCVCVHTYMCFPPPGKRLAERFSKRFI